MAYFDLDKTGNHDAAHTFARVTAMFKELYGALGKSTTSASLTKTAAATAGAATLNGVQSGKITSEALSTAAAASYTLTLTNDAIAASDQVFVSVANGTNTGGKPIVGRVTPGAGTVAVEISNEHASTAFNGTLVVSFLALKN